MAAPCVAWLLPDPSCFTQLQHSQPPFMLMFPARVVHVVSGTWVTRQRVWQARLLTRSALWPSAASSTASPLRWAPSEECWVPYELCVCPARCFAAAQPGSCGFALGRNQYGPICPCKGLGLPVGQQMQSMWLSSSPMHSDTLQPESWAAWLQHP